MGWYDRADFLPVDDAGQRCRRRDMPDSGRWVVVGLDNGGTTNNATVLDAAGRFLVDQLAECPSCVQDGPDKAIEALDRALEGVLDLTGIPRAAVRAVGLDTPGPV